MQLLGCHVVIGGGGAVMLEGLFVLSIVSVCTVVSPSSPETGAPMIVCISVEGTGLIGVIKKMMLQEVWICQVATL